MRTKRSLDGLPTLKIDDDASAWTECDDGWAKVRLESEDGFNGTISLRSASISNLPAEDENISTVTVDNKSLEPSLTAKVTTSSTNGTSASTCRSERNVNGEQSVEISLNVETCGAKQKLVRNQYIFLTLIVLWSSINNNYLKCVWPSMAPRWQS